MKVYVIEVISLSNPFESKISQEGYFTLKSAQDWCRKKPGAIEINNGWAFESDDYEYMIHEILVR